jgi:hypothetical protein
MAIAGWPRWSGAWQSQDVAAVVGAQGGQVSLACRLIPAREDVDPRAVPHRHADGRRVSTTFLNASDKVVDNDLRRHDDGVRLMSHSLCGLVSLVSRCAGGETGNTGSVQGRRVIPVGFVLAMKPAQSRAESTVGENARKRQQSLTAGVSRAPLREAGPQHLLMDMTLRNA